MRVHIYTNRPTLLLMPRDLERTADGGEIGFAGTPDGIPVTMTCMIQRLEPSLAGRPTPWDWDAFAVAQAHDAGLAFAAAGDAS
jgi:hypothetical protein